MLCPTSHQYLAMYELMLSLCPRYYMELIPGGHISDYWAGGDGGQGDVHAQ